MNAHDALTLEIRSGPSGPKIGALFDLDQTLLAGFSATAFFRERLLSGGMPPKEFSDSLLGVLSFALGRTGFSGLMAAPAAAYRGMAEASLREFGEAVFEKHLAAQIYPESRVLVEAHQEMGHSVAIISSATPYQAEPLARALGISHVLCTRLEVEDGIFTGRVVRPTCWGEGKARAARELGEACDLDLGQSYFYTDSHEDLPLLEIVGHPRPLNPSRQLAQIAKERNWRVRRFKSHGTPDVGDLLRTALAYGSVFPSLGAGILTGLLSGSRREAVGVAGSLWSDLATSLAGVDLRVEGEAHLWSRRPAVFVFNHQSGLDVLLMLKMLRRDVMGIGKEAPLDNPILGPVLAAAGVFRVDRLDSAKSREAALEALRGGRSLAIASEAMRSGLRRPGHFEKGALRVAMQADVPVVPVVFRNVLDALPRHAIVVRAATVEAVVLPALDTSTWAPEDIDSEIAALRGRYLEVLER